MAIPRSADEGAHSPFRRSRSSLSASAEQAKATFLSRPWSSGLRIELPGQALLVVGLGGLGPEGGRFGLRLAAALGPGLPRFPERMLAPSVV